ncbi:MAG: tRNA 5-methoxyuridine(34)/uridine 5-oxyacetic acid(34) synthase CmoB [Deltaproteobacteria bacterium]|jgi:tRNA (mo5U34)-methyltransferase
MPDYLDLEPFRAADKEKISRLRTANDRLLHSDKKGVLRFRQPFEAVCHLRARFCDFSGDVVRIGRENEIAPAERERVWHTLRAFMPWRKGPFEVFGIEIDAEWRSERKWSRLHPALPELAGKVVADIGSNNGYYMFRMAHHRPRLVVGFEPYLQHHFTFRTLNDFAGRKELHSELLGVEHIGLYADCFDVIFLMGIIYHRSSPFEVMKEVRKAMRPGGVLIVESQAIPGEEPVALFPEQTYAKVPGTYFVPTGACLENWLRRAGFQETVIFASHPMADAEQRRTDWMTFESFADFLDPADPGRTIEGYPAPWRVFLRAINPA